jgi:hypothetical protein
MQGCKSKEPIMRQSKKIIPVIFLLVFGIVSTGQASGYYTYKQSTFTISVPKTWHKIPQQYLDTFAEQIRMQFRNNPSMNSDWAVYDCGFQKNSADYGITPPVVIIKTDNNPKLVRALNNSLNTMREEKVSLTYQQAGKILSSQISQIIDSSVKNILFDKQKKMLRFSLDTSDGINHVKNLTSIYISNDTIYHIMCTTLANIYNQDEKAFLHMSNSFQVSPWQQSHPTQDTNTATNVESKEIQKLEMKELVTDLAQGQFRNPIPEDEQFTTAIVGAWKEFYEREGLEIECLIIYYPDHTYEQYATYLIDYDASWRSNGTWMVRGGYVYYKDGDGMSSIRILSIDKKKANYQWDDGVTCRGFRVDIHNVGLESKDDTEFDSDAAQDIYKERSTPSLYQESHMIMIKEVIENYDVFDESRAINILQDWINKEEDNANVIRLSVEDNSSNRFVQTYLVTYTIAKGSDHQKYMYEYTPNTESTRKMVHMHNEN